MALTEVFTSRNWHRTQDGDTVELEYVGLWSDWESGVGIPKIGDVISVYTGWSTDFDYMKCSDVQCWAMDNLKCRILVLFSTDNRAARPRAKDERSWTLNIEANSNEQEIDVFYDIGADLWRLWGGENGYWHDSKPVIEGEDNETVPPIYKFQTSVVMKLTAYSDAYYPETIVKNVGHAVNSDDSFHDSLLVTPKINIAVGTGEKLGNDSGSWLFASCPISMLASDLYRYDMTFYHAGYRTGVGGTRQMDTWSYLNGVIVNQYPAVSFLDMLDVLKGADKDVGGGYR